MGKEKIITGYFGKDPNYVSTVNGVDQLNVNSDKYTQVVRLISSIISCRNLPIRQIQDIYMV